MDGLLNLPSSFSTKKKKPYCPPEIFLDFGFQRPATLVIFPPNTEINQEVKILKRIKDQNSEFYVVVFLTVPPKFQC